MNERPQQLERVRQERRERRKEALHKPFRELLNIPAPTGKEQERVKHIREMAERMGWESREDDAGNISVHIPASSGYDQVPLIVLQAHLDMVTIGGNNENPTQWSAGPDGWIRSDGNTTLGADNAAGAAIMMKLMEDVKEGHLTNHGAISLLFTVGEEATDPERQPNGEYTCKGGLRGARELDAQLHFGHLKGEDVILVNTDSEEGLKKITVGSAAGATLLVEINSPEQRDAITSDDTLIEFGIKDFLGGHSGMKIREGRGNALVALGWVVWLLREQLGIDARIVDAGGGEAPNAIADTARCVLAVPSRDQDRAVKLLERLANGKSERWSKILNQAGSTNPEEKPKLTKPRILGREERNKVLSTKLNEEATNDFVHLLTNIPFGPVAKTSSNNVGTLKTDKDGRLVLTVMPRSTRGKAMRPQPGEAKAGNLEQVTEYIEKIIGRTKSKKAFDARYGHWQELKDARRAEEIMKKVTAAVAGDEPESEETPGGLEVAVIIEKLLDEAGVNSVSAVSAGPEVNDAHEPVENLNKQSAVDFDEAAQLFLVSVADPDADINDLYDALVHGQLAA